MKVFAGLAKRTLYCFSKKIITMNPVKVDKLELTPTPISPNNQSTPPITPKSPRKTIEDWQTMPFDQLCSLSQQQLNQIEKQIKKTKMNVNEQYFTSETSIGDPQTELPPYWLQIYKMFTNLEPIPVERFERMSKGGYLARMILDDPEEDERLLGVLDIFVNNLHDVKKLEGIAQPTFCKYLLSLKRDLQMQGLNIETYLDPRKKPIKLTKILSYQYEFWLDISHNRQKNGTPQQFLLLKKTIPNPNTTLAITEQFPTIDITYIKRKKKREDIEMNFVIKMLVQIQVDGNRHLVKVERKGPSSRDGGELRMGYLVIDYDGVFKGNPTIRPIFQF